jgi:isopentenyl-diphosphate delta-isomerase
MYVTDRIPVWIGGQLVPFDKDEAHRKGLLHKAVAVFVICRDAVLIHQRAKMKSCSPGIWASTCCAHPRWEERPETCANRRLYEDMGLRDMPLVHSDTLQYRARVNSQMVDHEVVDIFTARVPAQPVMSPNPRDVMDTRWENLTALSQQVQSDPSAFTPLMQIYLRDHIMDLKA